MFAIKTCAWGKACKIKSISCYMLQCCSECPSQAMWCSPFLAINNLCSWDCLTMVVVPVMVQATRRHHDGFNSFCNVAESNCVEHDSTYMLYAIKNCKTLARRCWLLNLLPFMCVSVEQSHKYQRAVQLQKKLHVTAADACEKCTVSLCDKLLMSTTTANFLVPFLNFSLMMPKMTLLGV